MSTGKKTRSDVKDNFPLLPVSLIYRDAVQSLPPEFRTKPASDDLSDPSIWETNLDNYAICGKIGSGRYSDAYALWDEAEACYVCGKILKPASVNKAAQEVHMLRLVAKMRVPFTIRLRCCLFDASSQSRSLVFEHINHVPDWRRFYCSLTPEKIAYLFGQILIGLDGLHSVGVMHRDVKPQNVLTDGKTLTVRVADFGLADFYVPGQAYKTSLGSRFYKAPELALRCARYWYAADLWGAGCILTSMMVHRFPLFPGTTAGAHIASVAKIVGRREIVAALPYLRLAPPADVPELSHAAVGLPEVPANPFTDDPALAARLAAHDVPPPAALEPPVSLSADLAEALSEAPIERSPLSTLITDKNRAAVSDLGLDLAEKLLTVNPFFRPTAAEALAHPFFDGCRDELLAQADAMRKQR